MEEEYSIQASEQDDYKEQITEYELEQAMLEAEFVTHEMARWESDPIEEAIMLQEAQDRKMFQQEMELEKRMAKMQVQYRNMDGQMLHHSRSSYQSVFCIKRSLLDSWAERAET